MVVGIRMIVLPESVLYWLGGLIDGDGCVYVRSGSTLGIQVSQATRGSIAIDLLQKLFGGTQVIIKAKKQTHQDTHRWSIEGTQAVALARLLADYLFIKKPQFELAGTFPTQGKGSVCILRHSLTQEERQFSSMEACSLSFGLSKKAVANWQKGYRGCHKPKALEFWDVQIKTLQDAKVVKTHIDKNLRLMKKLEHEAFTMYPPAAYFSGVFDAEGSVAVSRSQTLCVSLPQIYTPVLDALKVHYGGSVLWAGNKYKWSCGTGAREFLKDIMPYAIGKLPQILLGLQMQRGEATLVHQKLKRFKGHQDYSVKEVNEHTLDKALESAGKGEANDILTALLGIVT